MMPKIWSRQTLAYVWVALGVVSLFVSGFFALFISVAKVPGLAHVLTQIDFFRRALVVHVDLSVVVWFMCMPVAFIHYVFRDSQSRHWLRFSFSAALAAVLVFAIAGFLPEGRPLLSNYIPVVTHPLYLAGLFLFFIVVAFNYLMAFTLSASEKDKVIHWGLRLGAAYFLLGLFVLISSLVQVPLHFKDEAFYEIGVWGYGHLQQFSNLIFMIVAWTLLLRSWDPRAIPSNRVFSIVLIGLALPLVSIPFLLGYEPNELGFRRGFTEIMRWGMFPPSLILLFAFVFRIRSHRKNLKFWDFRFITFMGSALLLIIGFVFGAFIRGPDLRLPGHYHATIGAVTLSFIGVAFVLLDGIKNKLSINSKLRIWSPILYGLGQFGFAGGMFIAGSFGMGRKMYGVEQEFLNFGQKFGMFVMAAGGVLALVGGFVFAIAALPSFFKSSKT